jgi:hypothetical protein
MKMHANVAKIVRTKENKVKQICSCHPSMGYLFVLMAFETFSLIPKENDTT